MTLKRANVDNKLVFLLTLINLFVWPILNTFQDRFRGFRSYQTNLDSFVALFSSACFSLFYGILATSSSSQMTMRLLYSTSEQWYYLCRCDCHINRALYKVLQYMHVTLLTYKIGIISGSRCASQLNIYFMHMYTMCLCV